MGRRLVRLDIGFLLDCLKDKDKASRSVYVSKNPLPDDAHYAGHEFQYTSGDPIIELVLASDQWYGDSRELIPEPEMTVVWGPAASEPLTATKG